MANQQDFDTRFDQMGKEIDTMVADGRNDLRDERTALKNKWDSINARRQEIKAGGEGAWNTFEGEMDGAWSDIKSSFDDVKGRFGNL